MLSPRLLLAASLCLAFARVTPSHAEAVTLAGRILEVSAPEGYCVLDPARPAENVMIEALTKFNAEQTRLLVPFGRCDELVDLRAGKRPKLDHFGQILALLQKGQVHSIEAPTEVFLEGIGKPFPTASIGNIADNGEAQFKALGGKLPPRLVAQLGRDDLAVYIGNTSVQQAGPQKIVIIGTIGITLVNQVPLSVNMFAVYEGGKGQGESTIRGVLEQLRRAVIDLHWVNEGPADVQARRALPPPTAEQWKRIGSSALVGGLIGAIFGLLVTAAILLVRRRRRRRAAASAG